ncbi:MAG: hypothetical protein ACKV2T_24635 [Kofleriaceae bacterium]
MSDERKKDVPTTTEVTVNWNGLARFLGWNRSVDELKRVELESPAAQPARRTGSDD